MKAVLLLGMLTALAVTAHVVRADPPPVCTYCKLTPAALQGGPACTLQNMGPCGNPVPVVNCVAGRAQPNSKFPTAGMVYANCQPSSAQYTCLQPLHVPIAETECQENGQMQLTAAGCPQGQFRMGCITTRVNTGKQVSVVSCADQIDPTCAPDPNGGAPSD